MNMRMGTGLAGLLGTISSLLALGCGPADMTPNEPSDEPVETTSEAITLPNLGVYCSTVRPDGGWFMAWGSSGDPCNWLATNHPPAGVTKHKGLYSLNATNTVVLTCNTNSGTTPPTVERKSWRMVGDAGLQAAYTAAQTYPAGHCNVVVSPNELPILKKPFGDPPPGQARGCAGFNYSRQAPLAKAQLTDGTFQPRNTVARNGKQMLANGWDVGHDCGLPLGTPLLAMAEGTVVQAGCWDTDNPSKTEEQQHQRDVIIEHVITGPTAGYEERFYTLYAHLSSIGVSVGQTVTQGQQIGLAGETGWAGGSHLHYMVGRRTNTVDQLQESPAFPGITPAGAPLQPASNSILAPDQCGTNTDDPEPSVPQPPHDLDQMIIDPYGWAGVLPDPWAISDTPYDTPNNMLATKGGLSANLWIPGFAPFVGHDWRFTDGTKEIRPQTTSGKCMDVTNGSTADGAIIQQWSCNGTNAQFFVYEKKGTFTLPGNSLLSLYEIRNLASGKCLEIQGGSTSAGARVAQATCTGSSQQRFGMTIDWATGILRMHPQTVSGVSMCVDVVGGSTANGAQLQQWPCNSTAAQAFSYSG